MPSSTWATGSQASTLASREAKQRYTIVIVTHNMQQAARVAGKIFSTPDDSRTEEYVTGKFG